MERRRIDKLLKEIDELRNQVSELEAINAKLREHADWLEDRLYTEMDLEEEYERRVNELEILIEDLLYAIASRDRLLALSALDVVKDKYLSIFSKNEYKKLREKILKGNLDF